MAKITITIHDSPEENRLHAVMESNPPIDMDATTPDLSPAQYCAVKGLVAIQSAMEHLLKIQRES